MENKIIDWAEKRLDHIPEAKRSILESVFKAGIVEGLKQATLISASDSTVLGPLSKFLIQYGDQNEKV